MPARQPRPHEHHGHHQCPPRTIDKCKMQTSQGSVSQFLRVWPTGEEAFSIPWNSCPPICGCSTNTNTHREYRALTSIDGCNYASVDLSQQHSPGQTNYELTASKDTIASNGGH